MSYVGQRDEPLRDWSRVEEPIGLVDEPDSLPKPARMMASRRLLERRQSFLSFFHRRLERPQDAEDALQDFCMKVICAAERLRDDKKIDVWLRRILRNTLIDHYRRRAAWRRAEADYVREMQGAVLEFQADEESGCDCVAKALPMLRSDYAEILRRADLNEEPREQIATELGLTVNNVGVRLHRARRALKEKLGDIRQSCQSGGSGRCGGTVQ